MSRHEISDEQWAVIEALIPKKPTQRGRPGPSYRQRWKVERCFGWMANCRRLVVRYDRHLHIYRAFCLVAIILCCVDRILK